MNIKRRTLVRGAAWAVPSVIAATAAPAYAASPSGAESAICNSILISSYNSQTDSYPLSFTFGGSQPDTMTYLTVSVVFPEGTKCLSPLLGLWDSCDGLSGNMGSQCTQLSTGQWKVEASVTGGYPSYSRGCSPCPFTAVVRQSLPRGSVITVSNYPVDSGGMFENEAGPYWTYTFTLGNWGAVKPSVETVDMTNLSAPLTVTYQ